MDKARASYVKTVTACGTIGILSTVLLGLLLRTGALAIRGHTLMSAGKPIAWLLLLSVLALAALFFLAVALGGTICIRRDVEEKRRS